MAGATSTGWGSSASTQQAARTQNQTYAYGTGSKNQTGYNQQQAMPKAMPRGAADVGTKLQAISTAAEHYRLKCKRKILGRKALFRLEGKCGGLNSPRWLFFDGFADVHKCSEEVTFDQGRVLYKFSSPVSDWSLFPFLFRNHRFPHPNWHERVFGPPRHGYFRSAGWASSLDHRPSSREGENRRAPTNRFSRRLQFLHLFSQSMGPQKSSNTFSTIPVPGSQGSTFGRAAFRKITLWSSSRRFLQIIYSTRATSSKTRLVFQVFLFCLPHCAFFFSLYIFLSKRCFFDFNPSTRDDQ